MVHLISIFLPIEQFTFHYNQLFSLASYAALFILSAPWWVRLVSDILVSIFYQLEVAVSLILSFSLDTVLSITLCWYILSLS